MIIISNYFQPEIYCAIYTNQGFVRAPLLPVPRPRKFGGCVYEDILN